MADINTSEISRRVGFTLPAAFIADTLGIPPRRKIKAAHVWDASDFETIRAALVAHINAAPAPEVEAFEPFGVDDPLFGPAA
jgi:hypothetical protein